MTYIRHTRAVSRLVGVDGPPPVGPGKVLHSHRLVRRAAAGGLVLVPVGLRDKDGEGDVEDANVAPLHVLDETLAARPRLEPRRIQPARKGNVVKGDVGHVDILGVVGPQRPDAQAVGLVAHGAPLHQDVVRSVCDGDGVVAVVDDAVRHCHVGGGDAEAVRVEGEAAALGHGVDDGVRDGDVGALDRHVPPDGLPRLEVLDGAVGHLEAHQVRPVGEACRARRVGIPPLLPVRANPSSGDLEG